MRVVLSFLHLKKNRFKVNHSFLAKRNYNSKYLRINAGKTVNHCPIISNYTMNTINGIHILLVEDNEGDIFLTKEAFSDAKIINTVSVVTDGEEALNFLFKRKKYIDAITPDLVLMDINIPKIDGKVVLAEIKKDPILRSIPVVMLTTSSSERDIVESYKNYANCYITKPVDLNKFMEIVNSIQDFWISIVKLPKH